MTDNTNLCTTSEYEKQVRTRLRFALRSAYFKSSDDLSGLLFELVQLILEGDNTAIGAVYEYL